MNEQFICYYFAMKIKILYIHIQMTFTPVSDK
jgi:hypothetical protein